jgi:hypothetical protein
MTLLRVQARQCLRLVTAGACGGLRWAGRLLSRGATVGPVAGGAARSDGLVRILVGLSAVAVGALAHGLARGLAMGIVAVGASCVPARRRRVLLRMARLARLLLRAAVRLVTSRAGVVAGGRVRLRLMALRALLAACGGVVGQACVAALAVLVTCVLMRCAALGPVTIAAKRGLSHPGAESMRLVALRALQVRAPVATLVSLLFVTARAGNWCRSGLARAGGMRPVTVHAGSDSPSYGRVIGVHTRVAARTSTLGSYLHVVRVVTARAGAVLRHHGRTQSLVPFVTTLTGRGCGLAQVVVLMTAGAAGVAACKRRGWRNDGFLAGMAVHAGAADVTGRAVGSVAIQALLMNRPLAAGAGAVVQFDVLMTARAAHRVHCRGAVGGVAVEARLVGVHDDGLVCALCILVAIEALFGLAEEGRWGVDAEVEERCWTFQLTGEDVTTCTIARLSHIAVMERDFLVASVADGSSWNLKLTVRYGMAVSALQPTFEVCSVAWTIASHGPVRLDLRRHGAFWLCTAGRKRRAR